MIDDCREYEKLIPKNALAIHNILNNKGYKTYFVGGALRDYYISKVFNTKVDIKDWDMVTTAKHNDMSKIFNKILRINESGRIVSKIGKTELLIPGLETTGVSINNQMFEVTPMNTLCGDEIVFTEDIIEDLRKRDFTINTIAYSPSLGLITSFCDENGNTIDALKDIEHKVIRCTYDADKSFTLNRFHMIRAIIFANKFNFEIEEETFESLKRNIIGVKSINKGKLSIAFERMICGNITEKIKYLKISGFLSSLCEGWTDEYSDEFIRVLFELNDENNKCSYFDKLESIYCKFSNKRALLLLYKEFGVNKDYLMRLEKRS